MKIALSGARYHAHSPPSATSDQRWPQEPISEDAPYSRGCYSSPLPLSGKPRLGVEYEANPSYIPTSDTYTLRETGLPNHTIMPTRRPTSGTGTGGAASRRNGAAGTDVQERAPCEAPPERRLTPTSRHTSLSSRQLSGLGCNVGCLGTEHGVHGGYGE